MNTSVGRPYFPSKLRLQAYLDQTYQNGWLSNHGPLLEQLEQRLAETLGVPHVLVVANGTLALQLACRLLDLDGEVLTTPLSFVATPNALTWEGLQARFADVDPERLTLDPDAVRARITPRTRALMPVHLFGRACDVDGLERVAREHKLKVIYDAAHAFGVTHRGRSLLHWGDVSVLSFHATKVFHTGEGGALVIRDPALHERARLYRSHGRVGRHALPGLGINAKLSELHAAMGHAMLDEMPAVWAGLAEVQARYHHRIQGLPGVHSLYGGPALEGISPAYLPLRFDCPQACERVHAALTQADVALRRYFDPPLHRLPHLGATGDACPQAESLAPRLLCLPVRADLPTDTIDRVCDILQAQLGHGPGDVRPDSARVMLG